MIIYGKQIVLYAASKKPQIINELYAAKKLPAPIFSALKKSGKKIIVLDSKKAQALAHGGNHQGLLADIEPLKFCDLSRVCDFENALVLCGITDVGNIGAIARTALCLGAQALIIADIKLSDLAISTIIRASAGAVLELPICIAPSSLEIINNLKMAGFSLFGASAQGVDSLQFIKSARANEQAHLGAKKDKIFNKFALFLGAEDSGIPQKTLKKLDKILKIDMQNDFDSLNVATAAAILLDRLLNRG